MGNITDQFFVLFIVCHLFFCVCLQSQTHLFKILTELSDFIIGLILNFKIQIALFDIAGRCLQFCKRQ